MDTTTSADGTTIAYERAGTGPPLVTVVGAFCERGATSVLADALAPELTVVRYDRRGRGDSGNTLPYAVDREIEDLAAVLAVAGAETGGSVAVYGHSSGAALALLGAAAGLPIAKVIAYEPPYVVGTAKRRPDRLRERVEALLADGLPGEAAELFLREGPEAPDEVIEAAKAGPGWPYMERLAPTLPYDLAIVGDQHVPTAALGRITVPTLVLGGGASPAWAREAVDAVAAAVPGSRRHIVDGQDHTIDQEVLARLIAAFLRG